MAARFLQFYGLHARNVHVSSHNHESADGVNYQIWSQFYASIEFMRLTCSWRERYPCRELVVSGYDQATH